MQRQGSGFSARFMQAAREQLTVERRRVSDALRAYPSPVAGCDQQFNHLLAQRALIAGELARLDRIGASPMDEAARAAAVGTLIEGSPLLGPAVVARLRAEASRGAARGGSAPLRRPSPA